MTEPIQLETESVVRVAFAENGTLDDVLAALAGLRAHLAEQLDFGALRARQYTDGEGRYPQRVHLISLVLRFLFDQYTAADDWAAWAADQLAGWGDVTVEAADHDQVAATLAGLLARHAAARPTPA